MNQRASSIEPSPLMTPREVLQALNISRATLNTWCAEGKIEFVRLPGGHRRFQRDQVDAIARGEVSA